MDISTALPFLLLTALVAAVLYGVWVQLCTRHFIPVLRRALQCIDGHIKRQSDRGLLTVGLARLWLLEIRQYQSRLWLFGGDSRKYQWEIRLGELEEICVNVISAEAGEGKRNLSPVV